MRTRGVAARAGASSARANGISLALPRRYWRAACEMYALLLDQRQLALQRGDLPLEPHVGGPHRVRAGGRLAGLADLAGEQDDDPGGDQRGEQDRDPAAGEAGDRQVREAAERARGGGCRGDDDRLRRERVRRVGLGVRASGRRVESRHWSRG